MRRALLDMLRAGLAYLRARRRIIGCCPPHRYDRDSMTYAFCLDCGEYRDGRPPGRP